MQRVEDKDLTYLLPQNSKLGLQRFVANVLHVNCYVLYDKDTHSAIVIDPGMYAEEEKSIVKNFIISHDLLPKLVILTHPHFDHVMSLQWLYDDYGLKPSFMQGDEYIYKRVTADPMMVVHKELPFTLPPQGKLLNEGDIIEVDNIKMRCIETPGHTLHSACFYDEHNAMLFSGDSLFKDYIGLPKEEGIKPTLMKESLIKKIFILPPSTLVFPGHGPHTVISEEK